MPSRRESRLFDGHWRAGVDRATEPVGEVIRHMGVTADHLTAFGLVMAVAAAVVVASGRLGLGLVLLVASGIPDLLDGPVAKASGTAGPRGAFFDSVADRVTDSLVLGGIGWYLASSRGAHAAMLAFAVLATSTLISYQRAKAESLGYVARGGLMERAERVIALCIGLAFSRLLVPVLWLTLVLTAATAVQRFLAVWRQAEAPVAERGRVVRVRPDTRWRAWRESSALRGGRAPRSRRDYRGSQGTPWRVRRQERAWRRRATTRP